MSTHFPLNSKKISTPKFFICTLVTKKQEYQLMKNSFLSAGFSEGICCYREFDNSSFNKFDAYRAINLVISESPAPYIIFCHQDIRLDQGDGIDKLSSVIESLDRNHPDWAILGNSGVTEYFELIRHLSDIHEDTWCEARLPTAVVSLDENFLIIKKSPNIKLSKEIVGYHFYGSDICKNAALKGYGCYVVDFKLSHLGKGTVDDSFWRARDLFVRKWSKASCFEYFGTTCIYVFLSKHLILRLIFGRRFMIKYFQRNVSVYFWVRKNVFGYK